MERILYGEVYGAGLVFIQEANALELAQLHRAMWTAKTWGAFRELIGENRSKEITENWGGMSLDEYIAVAREERPELTAEAALNEYKTLSIWDRRPLDDDPFEGGHVPGVADGFYPEWPAQEALAWFPRDLIRDYGIVEDSMHNGYFLQIPEETETVIVAILRLLGYDCVRDDMTVRNASGYSYQSAVTEE